MKKQQTYKKILEHQDWYADKYSRKYGCWSTNHRTMAKNKVITKRLAKHRLRRIEKEEIENSLEDLEDDEVNVL